MVQPSCHNHCRIHKEQEPHSHCRIHKEQVQHSRHHNQPTHIRKKAHWQLDIRRRTCCPANHIRHHHMMVPIRNHM